MTKKKKPDKYFIKVEGKWELSLKGIKVQASELRFEVTKSKINKVIHSLLEKIDDCESVKVEMGKIEDHSELFRRRHDRLTRSLFCPPSMLRPRARPKRRRRN